MSDLQLSSQRKESLREIGIFPMSRDVTTAGVIIGALLGARPIIKNWQAMLGAYPSDLAASTLQFLYLIGWIPLGASLGGILATLIQSRFLISFALPSRLLKKNPSPLISLSLGIFKGGVIAAAGWLLFHQLKMRLLEGESSLRVLFKPFFYSSLVALVVFSLIGRFATQIAFQLRYKMSKEEYAAESREGEMRPEVRQATERAQADSEN